MFERAEFNLLMHAASFSPRRFSCTKNELMVLESGINNTLLNILAYKYLSFTSMKIPHFTFLQNKSCIKNELVVLESTSITN